MISNQKMVIILTAIFITLAPVIYVWRDELSAWWKNKKNDKDCSFEIKEAIDEHKNKNKAKKEKNKTDGKVLAPGRIKTSKYDFTVANGENHLDGYEIQDHQNNWTEKEKPWFSVSEVNPIYSIGGYLTKEEAYPDCSANERAKANNNNGKNYDNWVSSHY
jgi:hypothetical protein